MSLVDEIAAAKKGLERKKTFLESVNALAALLPRCRAACAPDAPGSADTRSAAFEALRRAQAVYLSRHDDAGLWQATVDLLGHAEVDQLGLSGEDAQSLAQWRQKLAAAGPSTGAAAPAPSAGHDWGTGAPPPPALSGAQLHQHETRMLLDILTGGVGPDEALPPELLEQLEAQSSAQPAAARHAKDDLLLITIPHDAKEGEYTCCVCQEDFEARTKAKKMPCGHLFHDDCLLSWLAKGHTCPICRFELPKEKVNYHEDRERVRKTDPSRMFS
eukprot:TRINITY_DN19908_c0_g1_i1.p1 TRINITY_DN19908_c0_g1~~TRINITY_DN19908_c0_g1_i1.p1  ORF type:complete len:295 (+),score=88.79 TRINITY_DN19908_c0_g1_i1:69-887(+)